MGRERYTVGDRGVHWLCYMYIQVEDVEEKGPSHLILALHVRHASQSQAFPIPPCHWLLYIILLGKMSMGRLYKYTIL